MKAALLVAGLLLPLAAAAEPTIRLVEFEGALWPYSGQRVIRAIDDAEAAGDALVLIELDTPGGLVSEMQKVVKRMLSSEVPIVVWVGPPGAHAASAGFFILVAADVAAMAPGTRTGAASTIVAGGENREDDVGLKKANEDNAALLRSIAERRGRDVDACEEAIFEARAFEDRVALERGIADLIANSREDLLEQLHGREIERFDGTTVRLETRGAAFVESRLDLRETFRAALGHPVVVYLLFLGGILGLYVEFTHPGVVFPGVVGALCLLLFAMASRTLPVSAVGVLLIALAAVMFLLEIKVTSYGMLSVGGVVCLGLGSFLLIDGPVPGMRVPPAVFLPSTGVLAGLCFGIVRAASRAQQAPVSTGVEGMRGAQGTVASALAPEGTVHVEGELWSADAGGLHVPAGVRVRVVAVEALRLRVEPVEDRKGD